MSATGYINQTSSLYIISITIFFIFSLNLSVLLICHLNAMFFDIQWFLHGIYVNIQKANLVFFQWLRLILWSDWFLCRRMKYNLLFFKLALRLTLHAYMWVGMIQNRNSQVAICNLILCRMFSSKERVHLCFRCMNIWLWEREMRIVILCQRSSLIKLSVLSNEVPCWVAYPVCTPF